MSKNGLWENRDGGKGTNEKKALDDGVWISIVAEQIVRTGQLLDIFWNRATRVYDTLYVECEKKSRTKDKIWPELLTRMGNVAGGVGSDEGENTKSSASVTMIWRCPLEVYVEILSRWWNILVWSLGEKKVWLKDINESMGCI